MSDEMKNLIAAAIVTLAQVYVLEPWKFPVFAEIWDTIARICGILANYLARCSMLARANYYDAIHAYGE
jgi:hypothetical protein